MVKKEGDLYVCEECGFSYDDESWAGKCEVWCKKTHSCNLDIVKHRVKGGSV